MKQVYSSFRDPDGYVFEHKSEFYRAVYESYKTPYEHFISSGLCQILVKKGFLLPFDEIEDKLGFFEFYKILKPKQIKFISYPYEWSFSMLKDAAILTLTIQQIAIEYGMSLKDASAFNVQFINGRPIFIDTLSFEIYKKDRPWIAYRQFCEHFVAPLALMARVNPGLNRMFIINLDGISLSLAKKILPFSARFNLELFLHIFLHEKFQRKHEDSNIHIDENKKRLSLFSMKVLINGLMSTIKNQNWKATGTEWSDYNSDSIHSKEYLKFKTEVLTKLLDYASPNSIWDIGANDGFYSRLAANKGIEVISCDFDTACVENNYLQVKQNKESNILPLLFNILNPSPSIGWDCKERCTINNRNRPDLIMALAIIHHLSIRSNIPFFLIASYFASISSLLIIEFVPKEDSKVKQLLLNRDDEFTNYTQSNFELAFLKYYKIEQRISSSYNNRIFYLMKKHE